ncbi:ABC transporter ATP-binding protein [Phyllobacterium salinisoli]|uniref:ABC transporter ATP-binding protein n=1 Tax=Phyllobacterium salinisoli TaxID=1899321 RepID=A0A368KA32_9HYPH|nr:dipeptide ABC transporter ATP-binding protein [Phyllobacterium salinisoli]RCS25363.1 ABC transporter ATP-binding protein [Phyllobacterium salinisoli]
MALLEIERLSVSIGATSILRDVDMTLDRGMVHALVGESGSGKTMTALALMQLLPHGAAMNGHIRLAGKDIATASESEMCRLRGAEIGMVFQEPMTALNPVKTIGEQVAEGIRWHTGASRAEAEEQARAMLDRVGLPPARFPLDRYPHQLSGGQRQRVVIAIACALKPRLLIADEPTTALDVILQAQILDLLKSLVAENDMGLLLISHDLAVVADMADRITILRRGEVVESGETVRVLSAPADPYTRRFTQASLHMPDRPAPKAASGTPLLSVGNLTREYPGSRIELFSRAVPTRAVDNVSFEMAEGQSIALVGRSGCGKSTLARMVLALDRPTSGEIRLDGQRIDNLPDDDALRQARQKMQIVFQDPYGSFDPRQKAETLVAEPLHLLDRKPTPVERRERVATVLERVGLSPDDMDKYPHQFSGGQRQRLAIARAIITGPKLVVADEPVSALDVSIRARILDLFADLTGKLGLAWLFITHDLNVARAMAEHVIVMDEGRIVEQGRTDDVLQNPQSEAARALVAASPDLRLILSGKLREQG